MPTKRRGVDGGERNWGASIRWFAAEFAVVVSGILVALALQAWWTSRQDRATELRLLRQMLVDLRRDSTQLAKAAVLDSMSAVRADFTASRLDARAPYSPVIASALNGIGTAHTLSLHTAQYETLKSRGLDLIRNDSLRTAISDFFEESVPELEKQNEWLRTAESRWMIVLLRLFRPARGTVRQVEPRNYTALVADNDFRLLLDEYAYYMRYVRPWKRSIGGVLNRLMRRIERELDAREPGTRSDARTPNDASRGDSANGSPSAGVAGCYVMHVGEYVPDVGVDRQYFLPPDTVELTQILDSGPSKAFIARPGILPHGKPGLWRMRGDTIQMGWNDGTTGVLISAHLRQDSLVGQARPISDIVVPESMRSKATVTAVRTACRPPV